MDRRRGIHLLSAALVAALVFTTAKPVKALSLNFVDGNEGFPADSALVNDDQTFAANLLVVAGSVTVSANLSVHATTAIAQTTIPVTIPPQAKSITLVPNPTVINSNPTGTATLVTEQEKTVGSGLTELTNADLQDANILLLSSQPVQTNSITVDGNAVLDILGLFSINLDIDVTGYLAGTLNNITFVQDPVTDGLVGLGNVNPPPNPPNDYTTQYTMSVPGMIGGNIAASFLGNMNIDLGIFGSIDQNLDGLAELDQDVSEHFDLPGVATLTDLEPGVFSGPGRDMQATFGLDLSGLPIPFILTTSATVPVNIHTSASGVDLDVTGTATLILQTTVVLQGTNYQLQDSVPDVVAPEPSSLWLIAIGALGLFPTFVRRWRRRRG